MRKKIWVHKATSFEEAERFERRYYAAMSRKERLETVEYLRRLAQKMRKLKIQMPGGFVKHYIINNSGAKK